MPITNRGEKNMSRTNKKSENTTKSKEIMETLDETELKILLLCFSKPKVMEAMRIYNKIPAHGKIVFYEEGKKQMVKLNLLNSDAMRLLQGGMQ